MDKTTLEKMATSAFEHLATARAALFGAAEGAIEAKLSLDEGKAVSLATGAITATNDKGRDAELRMLLKSQYEKLAIAEKTERTAHHQFDQASIEVDTLKTLLRIAELQ